jgi:hypothetical protein
MADPVSLAAMGTMAAGAASSAAPAIGAASLGTSIFGSLLGAAGAQQQGKAQSAQYGYQAGMALINKQIAEQNANYAATTGEMTARDVGMKGAQQEGQIIASQASSGLDVNSGSAKQVQKSQSTISQLDMDTIRMNAAKTAYDYETQAQSRGASAQMDLMAGTDASKAAGLNVTSSLVGGASSVASKWLQGNQMGLWGASS